MLRLLGTLSTSSIVFVAKIDLEGRFTYVSPLFQERFGFLAEVLMGTDSQITICHPDRELHREAIERCLEKPGSLVPALLRKPTPEGDFIYTQWEFCALEEGGTVEEILCIGFDSSGKIRALPDEKAARPSYINDHFRTLVENVSDIVYSLSMNGRFQYVSPSWTDLLGHPVEEVLGRSWDEFVHPDDLGRCAEFLLNMVSHWNPVQTFIDYRALHRNGSWRWHRSRASKSLNSDGELVFHGVASDITEQKLADETLRQQEAELRELNERFAMAANSAGIGVWEFDFESGAIIWDEWTFKLYEKEPQKEPLTFFDWKKTLHPEDLPDLLAKIAQARQAEQTFESEFRLVRPNGEWKYVKASAHIVRDAQGIARRMIGINYDITQIKRTELELATKERMLGAVAKAIRELLASRDIYQAVAQCFEILGQASGADRVYLFQNSFDAEGNGVTSQKIEWNSGVDQPQIDNPDLQNVPFEAVDGFFQPIFRDGALNALVRDIEDEDTRDLLASQNIKAILVLPVYVRRVFWGFLGFDECKQERIWTQAEFSVLRAFAHSLEKAIERRMIEEELEKAFQTAEVASKAKSQFLANMSHEIRTPLNGVIGFIELLANMPLESVQRQYVDNINSSAHALLGLINDILDFSKIEAGKLELEEVKTDLLDLAEQTADMVKVAAGKKNIELLLNISPELPRFSYVDPIRLRQVLINLLGNAVKFTEKGEVEISITFEPDPQEESFGYFYFSVRDTGIGISAEQQARLFQAFSQADASTTKKYGGTGLGLVISNKLLEKMGSGLVLDSEPGLGSTFSFSLYRRYAKGDPLQIEKLNHIHRALIIDDNEHNRIILQHMFRNWNIESDTACDGLEALEMLEHGNSPYEVITVDYNMPGLNGLEVIRLIRQKLRRAQQDPTIILMHSSADDSLIHEECRRLKVRVRMEKPIKMHDLFRILANLHAIDLDPAPALPVAAEELPPSFTAANGPVVLVAEDNLINRRLINLVVSRLVPGGRIVEAVNGEEAVALFHENQPDLILMDIQMPEKDGYTATREIRSWEALQDDESRVPIIALTAGAILGEKERCLEAGMDDFLTKPIDQKALKAAFDHFLSVSKG